jgi:alanine racemase
MTVVSRIAKLKVMRDAEPVSYGSTYRCRGRRHVATIPMGYADGYRRGLSNRFYVLVRGRRARVIGTVCMDMFMADVSDVDGVRVGDEVLVFGRRDEDCLPAEEMAQALGTINYEIVTGVSRRVPRIYRST